MVYHHEYDEEDSDVIRMIEYDSSGGILNVELEQQDGTREVYLYKKVDPEVYEEFINAESMGQYFNKEIKGEYETYKKV